jgi:C1A family cysteine protease
MKIMKRALNVFLTLILALAIITGNSSVFASQSINCSYESSDLKVKSISGNLSEPGKAYFEPNVVLHKTQGTVDSYKTASIPSSYDLRKRNKLTSVKNQGSSMACWAFSAIGSLESCLLTGTRRDFSENNLKNNNGFDYGTKRGGNYLMSTAYFARWGGPFNESSDPFNQKSTKSKSTGPVQKHVQNVIWLPERNGSKDNAAIKNAIMKYGAVSASMNIGGNDEKNISNKKTKTYYRSYSSEINHYIDIVGWDDNFSRSKFRDYDNGNKLPAGNGAFIVKNSWGSSWGDKGYFYISYYDMVLGYGVSSVYCNAESTGNYKNIYQYDPLGYTEYYLNNTNWMANVFTAKPNDGSLSAVSFYTLQTSTTYNVYICNNFTNKNDLYNKRVLAATGTIENCGYSTIKLSAPVQIYAGKKFAIIVQLSSADGVRIPLECIKTGYSSRAGAKPGESYYSSAGLNWNDLTNVDSTANVCLKAFTSSSRSNYFTYSISDSKAKIAKYTGTGGAVDIPAKLGGYPVTKIDVDAFSNCIGLTGVTIPSTVTEIADTAFYGCTGLTSANFLGNAPTMGLNVFYLCAPTFKVYYYKNKTGFTNPWNGYPAVEKVFVSVKSVKLNKTTLTLIRGKTYKLTAAISPSNSNNKKVTWKSGSKAVATVSSTGTVKGIKKGTVYIYVYTVDGNKSAKCKVTVK